MSSTKRSKMTQNKDSNRANNHRSSPISKAAWLSVLLSLSSSAYGFHSSAMQPIAMTNTRSPGPFASSSESCGSLSTTSNSNMKCRQNDRRRQHRNSMPPICAHSGSTVLQYRGSDEESSEAGSGMPLGRWWSNFLPSVTATRTIAGHSEDDKQEVVDEYLEFLNRRYNRLHSDEVEDSSKPFSALNWLLQGSSQGRDTNDLVPTEKQQSDSLYVLGVAGLASQKLLQRHHMTPQQQQESTSANSPEVDMDVTTEGKSSSKSVRAPAQSAKEAAVEADYYKVSDSSKIGTIVAAKAVPILRRLRYMERRRQLLVRELNLKLQVAVTAIFKTLVKTLIYGPINTVKTVLEIGGGKKSLALAFTVAYATILILRPVLQAAVTEGTVAP